MVAFERAGVEVHVVTNANLRAYFAAQVEAFRPEVILTSTDDPAQLLLEAALRAESARVVYLARATLAVPFGPDCAFPSEAKTERLRAADRVVGVSQYVADYFRKYAGIDAVHVPISLLEPGDWPDTGPLRQRIRHPGESLRGEGHFDFPGAGRCLPARRASPPCRPGAPTGRTAPR